MRKSDDRAFHFVGFGKKTDDGLDLLRQMERFAVACKAPGLTGIHRSVLSGCGVSARTGTAGGSEKGRVGHPPPFVDRKA